jgi:hypothetical protein
MISAMYENGGNTTHRFLDGHPQMFVYPFESQLGTRLVNDHLTSLFPVRYRWPVFPLDSTPADDYRLIIDEECRVRARTPHVSKFRDVAFDFSDEERARHFCRRVGSHGRSRAGNVESFFRATFEAWHNRSASAAEEVFVGYSPVIVVDGETILRELPGACLLHVVRNPWSAYADTLKRPVPLSLDQYAALLLKRRFPDRVQILRFEDLVADPVGSLTRVCEVVGVGGSPTLRTPTWNGTVLPTVYPWGTIRRAAPEANRETAAALPEALREEIAERAQPYVDVFDYESFLVP